MAPGWSCSRGWRPAPPGSNGAGRMDLLTLLLCALRLLLAAPLGRAQEEVPLLNLDEVELSGPMPRFLPTPTFYKVNVGDTAILECAVEELDDKKVVWRRASTSNPLTVGTESFTNSQRIMVEHPPDSSHWNLVIRQVELQDAGVYECQVSSRLRHLRHHILLEVREKEEVSTPKPARQSIFLTGSSVVDKDDRIYLICNATGHDWSPDSIDWFNEGSKLTSANDKISISTFVRLADQTIVSILEIRDAQLEDSGLYTCRTSNLLVKSMHVAVLNANTYNVKRGTHKGYRGGATSSLFSSSPGPPGWCQPWLYALLLARWLQTGSGLLAS